jgi:hypothetical protein
VATVLTGSMAVLTYLISLQWRRPRSRSASDTNA